MWNHLQKSLGPIRFLMLLDAIQFVVLAGFIVISVMYEDILFEDTNNIEQSSSVISKISAGVVAFLVVVNNFLSGPWLNSLMKHLFKRLGSAAKQVQAINSVVEAVALRREQKTTQGTLLVIVGCGCYAALSLTFGKSPLNLWPIVAGMGVMAILQLQNTVTKWRVAIGAYGSNAVEAAQIVEHLIEHSRPGDPGQGRFRSVFEDRDKAEGEVATAAAQPDHVRP